MNTKSIFEIGAGDGNFCESKRFWNSDIPIYLFEPSPILFPYLLNKIKQYKNIQCMNEAIYTDKFRTKFYNMGNSSYIEGVNSFMHTYLNQVKVNPNNCFSLLTTEIITKSIKQFDFGNIDMLLLDCEGCEYKILEELASRPKIISLSTLNQSGHQLFRINEIYQWLAQNNYRLVHRTNYRAHFQRL